MKLNPQYSYEFNQILNEKFNEDEQIKNFASLISDKDRFFAFFPEIENNKKTIELILGTQLPDSIDFFIVRAETFKSFSLPITIEYSIQPEEMVLFLLKEIIKINAQIRFPDEQTREQYCNATIRHLCETTFTSLNNHINVIEEESNKLYGVSPITLDFSQKTLFEHVQALYD